MSSRSEKSQKLQNKHHQILRDLVQEDNNKTCADCLAKGPRWASWSLGVYLCIRCAGIHRNLGVHISKVKSVDLDSWTHDQVEHILKWGNKRANEYYECYLPKDFARPQGNSAVESFIRSKYERKMYMKKDGEPAANPECALNRLKALAETEADAVKETVPKRRERPEKKEVATSGKSASDDTTLNVSKQALKQSKPEPSPVAGERPAPSFAGALSPSPTLSNRTPVTKPSPSFVDLLTLDDSPAPAIEADFGIQTSEVQPTPVAISNVDLLNFGNSIGQSVPCVPAQNGNLIDVGKNDAPKFAKESILSLYGNATTSQQPVYGVPGGLYMAPSFTPYQQQPFMNVSALGGAAAAYGYASSTQMMALRAQMQQMQVSQHVADRTLASQSQPGSSMTYPAAGGFLPMQSGDLFQQQAVQAHVQSRQTRVSAPQTLGVGPGRPTQYPLSSQPGYPSAAYGSPAAVSSSFGYGGPVATRIMNPGLTPQTNIAAAARTPQPSTATGRNLVEWGGGNRALAGVTYGQRAVMANDPVAPNVADFSGSGMSQGHTMSHQLWN